jgi:hypothetical protein
MPGLVAVTGPPNHTQAHSAKQRGCIAMRFSHNASSGNPNPEASWAQRLLLRALSWPSPIRGTAASGHRGEVGDRLPATDHAASPMPATDVERRRPPMTHDGEALADLALRCRRLMLGIRDDQTRQVLADMAAELEARAVHSSPSAHCRSDAHR